MGSSPGGGGGQRAFGTGAGWEMSPGAMDWFNNRIATGNGGSLSGMFGIGAQPAFNGTFGGPEGKTPIAPTTTGTATSGPGIPPPMVIPQPRANLAALMNHAQQYTGRSQASMRR